MIQQLSFLLLAMLQQNKPENMPQVFDNFTLKMNVGNTTVNLSLSDGAGGEKFIRLRSLNYLNKDIILLLFSWYPETNEGDNYQIPKIIVGTDIKSTDERNNQHNIELFQGSTKSLRIQSEIF
ncbi:unnamed protein product [Paramecium sonneborni]|uniref:Uncharacterized protein n=1 Tax=Paramecium sonneborni TaxID=65129 RepID=A0A8S1RQC9_9CILI|nr:unnamed protein product [Paramecium sonneborni]